MQSGRNNFNAQRTSNLSFSNPSVGNGWGRMAGRGRGSSQPAALAFSFPFLCACHRRVGIGMGTEWVGEGLSAAICS